MNNPPLSISFSLSSPHRLSAQQSSSHARELGVVGGLGEFGLLFGLALAVRWPLLRPVWDVGLNHDIEERTGRSGERGTIGWDEWVKAERRRVDTHQIKGGVEAAGCVARVGAGSQAEAMSMPVGDQVVDGAGATKVWTARGRWRGCWAGRWATGVPRPKAWARATYFSGHVAKTKAGGPSGKCA
ncbi:hypothetical protein B0H14DRAFT_2564305 [Mycena olivaceomarginata]|nr:hypothetical protein B0H14DRAFT_2564305 [Mycena olivaceomarginata]